MEMKEYIIKKYEYWISLSKKWNSVLYINADVERTWKPRRTRHLWGKKVKNNITYVWKNAVKFMEKNFSYFNQEDIQHIIALKAMTDNLYKEAHPEEFSE